MGDTREDRAPWKVHGFGPARVVALVSTLAALTAIALTGCADRDVTRSAGSTAIDGGVGLFLGGDGAASQLQVSIEPAAPTVCPGGCVSLSARAAGAAPPYAVAWSGLEGDGGTVQVCPESTTTYTATATASAAGRGEVLPQQPTGSASVTVTVTPACAGAGGTSNGDAGPVHEICSQSWSGVVNNQSSWEVPRARMLAIDGVGDMYVAATFTGTVTVAGQSYPSAGYSSLLVVKVDPACRVLWAKAFGAPGAATVTLDGIAADATGNVVVASNFTGVIDFGSGPVSGGTVVFKLGPDGAGLWSHGYQGPTLSGTELTIEDVAVEPDGTTMFTAWMEGGGSLVPGLSPSVDFGGGAVSFLCSLVELDANGQFVFNVDASSAGHYPHSLTTDSAGRIWVAGYESGGGLDIVAFDASGHAQGTQSLARYFDQWEPAVRVDANDDVFTVAAWGQQVAVDGGGELNETQVYKFAASGSASWTSAGIPESPENDDWWAASPGRLAVAPSGSALVASSFNGSEDYGSVGTLTSAGGADSAVLRFDAQGHLIGAARWGGANDDLLVDLAVDAAGDAVIAGWSVPPGGYDGQSDWQYAIFVAKLGW